MSTVLDKGDLFRLCSCSAVDMTELQIALPTSQIKHAFDLLSSPVRLKILLLLAGSPHCVQDIKTHIGKSQTHVSHYLNDLLGGNLVKKQRNGKFIIYSLDDLGQKYITFLSVNYKT